MCLLFNWSCKGTVAALFVVVVAVDNFPRKEEVTDKPDKTQESLHNGLEVFLDGD